MSYQTFLSRKIRKIIFHPPVMLITLLSYLRKKPELYQNEGYELCYTLRHVRDSCSPFRGFVFGLICGCFISWMSLDIPLDGLSFLHSDQNFDKVPWQIAKNYQLFLFRFLEIPSSELQQLHALWSLLWSLCNYVCSIKLPIPGSWLYFLCFFCKGASSETKILTYVCWVSPSRGVCLFVNKPVGDSKSEL